ncbi:hypothetical protein [Providencia sp.]|uniref:hypothetical protein n=1 Tax=Providencia sp. TaxID=589 RepID=UPI003F95A5D8
MRSSLTSHQRDNRIINEIDVNEMSNSMAMLFIYHGPAAPTKNKQLADKNENSIQKIVR